MNKIKKIMVVICAVMIGVTSVGTTSLAASGGITVSCKSKIMTGNYSYGVAGHQLKIMLYGYERRSGGESIVTTTSISNGNYSSVSAVGYADSGYSFYKASGFGLVDGKLDAAKENVPVS